MVSALKISSWQLNELNILNESFPAIEISNFAWSQPFIHINALLGEAAIEGSGERSLATRSQITVDGMPKARCWKHGLGKPYENHMKTIRKPWDISVAEKWS